MLSTVTKSKAFMKRLRLVTAGITITRMIWDIFIWLIDDDDWLDPPTV
jgi:hypothetical protein